MSDLPVKLERVAHVILRVADLQRSMQFFGDTLGMTPRFNFGDFAFFDGGGVTLALNQNKAAVEFGRDLTEIVFECSDFHAAHRALQARGVTFARDPHIVTSDATHSVWACDFRDPDGHVLSITGRVPK